MNTSIKKTAIPAIAAGFALAGVAGLTTPATAAAAPWPDRCQPRYTGGPGADEFHATGVRANHMCGNGGNDTIYGVAGRDKITGGRGRDTLSGGKGGDELWGGPGGDYVYALGAVDYVYGGGGGDEIQGGVGGDILYGQAGSDTIAGGFGPDYIEPGPGVEGSGTTTGGDGDDWIVLRDGNNEYVDCGPGNDTVVSDVGDGGHNCETWIDPSF